MFLTEKRRSVPIFRSPDRYHLSDPFNPVLSSLLPIPAAVSATENLSWLSRACELLSVTISDATSLLLRQSSSLDPSPFLDSTTLSLLDSCNSISAFSDRLLRRLLFVRTSLRSRKPVLSEKIHLPRSSAIRSSSKPPHGEIDPGKNAIYAAEALSALVIGAIWVTLSGEGKECFEGLKVDAQIFPWGKDFNKVLEVAAEALGEGSVDEELEKMESSIRGSTAEMDFDGEMEKRKSDEMERASEEMREGLEKLKGSVNAVFRAALCARNAAVQSLLLGAKKKC